MMDEKPKPHREIKLLPVGESCRDFKFPDPEEELQLRFIKQKLEDMLTGTTKPFPTIIAEMEDAQLLENIRPFVLFSPMLPFTSRVIKPPTRECLEVKSIKSYGNLYCLVNPN